MPQRYGRSSWHTPDSRVTRHGWSSGAVWRLFGSSNGGKLDLLISLEKLPYYQKISRSAPDHRNTSCQALSSDHGSEKPAGAKDEAFTCTARTRFYTRVQACLGVLISGPPPFERKNLVNWSHFIDFSSTGMMATSVTDTQAGTPHALASLPTVEDVEKSGTSTPRMDPSWASDIEHVHVNDDPRQWSRKQKVCLFRFMTCLAMPLRTHPSADDSMTFHVLGMYRRVYCA